MTENEQNPESKETAVMVLASRLAEALVHISDIETLAQTEHGKVSIELRLKFAEFAAGFYSDLRDLADESKQNHGKLEDGREISITKSRDDEELPWVMVLAHREGQKSLFCLPDPSLIEAGNRVWSRKSQPVGRFTDFGETKDFSLMGGPNHGAQDFVDFAKAIVLACEIITDTNLHEADGQTELEFTES